MISGGIGDIGRAVALELAHRGVHLSLADLKEREEAEPLLAQLASLGVNAIYVQADLSKPDSVRRWHDETVTRLGIPSIIIPNAGRVTRKTILEVTPDEWQHELNVNLNGAFYLASTAGARLVEEKLPGSIVFIGSWAAHRGNKGIPAYCVSKAALRMLCQVLALELAEHGILVNEVAPGIVNAGLSAENVRRGSAVQERIPVKLWIEPEEVAWQVANLCDSRNRNMTGSVVVMDGGLSMTNSWSK
jgi:NAD(P)-dependent dehydrogenase (short-subunit alcohol dehydrogenase family)